MFKLPSLPYDYNALEPHIDEKTMFIHHTKHHAGYVDKLNAALAKHPQLKDQSLEELFAHLSDIPQDIRQAICNNGGGHYNHSLFWTILSPSGGGEPTGSLQAAITQAFDSFTSFKDQFVSLASSQFGSGWAWLVTDTQGKLCLMSTPNQDNPLMTDLCGCCDDDSVDTCGGPCGCNGHCDCEDEDLKDSKDAGCACRHQEGECECVCHENLEPILAVDVWEHAYYLKYQNRRADYLQAFWNVVNWQEVQKRYEAATQ